MKAVIRSAGSCCVAALVLLGGCEWGGRTYWLGKYEREIKKATRAIEAARNDAQRARAHAARARGFSEKARYSRAFKLISPEEYGRLFDLAINDHDQAVTLAPGDANVYLMRGLTIYDRAALEEPADPRAKQLFDAAKADFTSAIDRDARNERALDMRALVHTANGDHDQAIRDFAEVRKFNPHLGKLRLAEAYCVRGTSYLRDKRYDLAIADYEKAIELDVRTDGCACQPDAPLAWTYYEKGQYDKSWEAVHRAKHARRWIPAEFIAQLKQASGRDK